jgi:DHA1 family tetracycline resistance protein-like MFS transporter
LRSSPLVPLFLIVVVDVLGLTIMIPLLPFYAEKLGATPSQVGWLVGVYAACQLLSGPLLGKLSDVTGRKPLLVLTQGGTALGFLITALAPSLSILFIGRALAGATAGNLSLAQAYISDVTRPEDRAKAFGIIGIAFGLGFMVGPAISGFLAQFDYRDPVFAAAGLSAANMFNTWFVLPTVAPGGAEARGSGPGGRRLSLFDWGAYGEYFRRPVLSGRLWQFLLYAFGFSMFVAGLPLFLERRLTWNGMPFGPAQVGYTWAFAGLIGVFIQGPALGRLVQRFGEVLLNRIGLGSCVFGFAILAFCHSIPVLVIAMIVASLGGLVRPALTSLITHAASREEQGVVLGLTQSLQSIAMIVAPPLGGILIEHGQLTGWGLAASAATLAGFLIASSSSQPAPADMPQPTASIPP